MIGKMVMHQRYGKGTILSVDSNSITILFSSGNKTLVYPDAFDSRLIVFDNTDQLCSSKADKCQISKNNEHVDSIDNNIPIINKIKIPEGQKTSGKRRSGPCMIVEGVVHKKANIRKYIDDPTVYSDYWVQLKNKYIFGTGNVYWNSAYINNEGKYVYYLRVKGYVFPSMDALIAGELLGRLSVECEDHRVVKITGTKIVKDYSNLKIGAEFKLIKIKQKIKTAQDERVQKSKL